MGGKIHPTAIVDDRADLGENVEVGPYSIIEGDTVVGDDTTIGAYCHLGVRVQSGDVGALRIGKRSHIRSHAVFYAGSQLGDGLVTGHRITVREKTVAGRDLQIGTLCDIQGFCHFGDFVRMHSNVHVGQRSVIGDFVWLFPYVVLTNDPHPPSNELYGCTVGRYVAIATMSVVLPGVEVGEGALVGASTTVRENVPENTICVGNPGRIVGPTSKIKLRSSGEQAYPWRRHFHRGYPMEVVANWRKEFSD